MFSTMKRTLVQLKLTPSFLLLLLRVTTAMKINFEDTSTLPVSVPEGVTLRLYCTQDSTDNIEIRSPTKLIVTSSNLVDEFAEMYDFERNSTTCVLVIKNFTRNEKGIYICLYRNTLKYASVQALYSPSSDYPVCISNYHSLVIFDDLLQEKISFTCTSEEGNPHVVMQLHIFQPNSTENITDIQTFCTAYQQSSKNLMNHQAIINKVLSFSCHLDNFLESASFVCDVSQQFPLPYNASYRRTCSFGPINIPPRFSLSITPPVNEVHEGASVSLTCTTNIPGVGIEWINVPRGWKYKVIKSTNFSQVNTLRVKKQSDSEVIIQCIGTYGIRKVKASATIIFSNKSQGSITLVVICITAMIVLLILILLGGYAWKRRKQLSKPSAMNAIPQCKIPYHNEGYTPDTTELASTLNKNNANNKELELGNENQRGNSDLKKNDVRGEDTSEMCENPVYEPASTVTDSLQLSYCEDQYATIDKGNT